MPKFSNTKRVVTTVTPQSSIFGNPPTDYAEFESDGFLAFHGEARAWIDFNFGVGSLTRGASAPDLITLSATNIQTLGFNGVNTPEQVSTVIEINHNWAEGTEIEPHVHWYATDGNAGNVKWQLEYVLVDGHSGDTVPAPTTISVVSAAAGAWVSIYEDFPGIDATGITIGYQMHIRLFRDPTDPQDTYGSDAALATMGLHVLVDTLGSRGEYTK